MDVYEKTIILSCFLVSTLSILRKRVGKDQIRRVDAQADPFTAEKYHVDKLPTVVLLDGETVHMNRTGAIDVNEVVNWLKGE